VAVVGLGGLGHMALKLAKGPDAAYDRMLKSDVKYRFVIGMAS
jgi:D-arabinose 1-dehydrogenase-like Zn-dependent alcohol dehydrogenase